MASTHLLVSLFPLFSILDDNTGSWRLTKQYEQGRTQLEADRAKSSRKGADFKMPVYAADAIFPNTLLTNTFTINSKESPFHASARHAT
jgi:hypothetical protein